MRDRIRYAPFAWLIETNQLVILGGNAPKQQQHSLLACEKWFNSSKTLPLILVHAAIFARHPRKFVSNRRIRHLLAIDSSGGKIGFVST